jgi:hypothetical protein
LLRSIASSVIDLSDVGSRHDAHRDDSFGMLENVVSTKRFSSSVRSLELRDKRARPSILPLRHGGSFVAGLPRAFENIKKPELEMGNDDRSCHRLNPGPASALR